MIDEVTECGCGLMMQPTHSGSRGVFCSNCDRVQPSEVGDYASGRVGTVRDRIFLTVWRDRNRKFYPDQLPGAVVA